MTSETGSTKAAEGRVGLDELAPVLADLGLAAGAPVLALERPGGAPDLAAAAAAVRAAAARELPDEGALLLLVAGAGDPRALCAWRNALWPELHVVAWYRVDASGLRRRTLAGAARIEGALPGREGALLVARKRAHVLSPAATALKFDTNAPGWNGEPGTPGYRHFRWMRRYVGTFAPRACVASPRVLDFGCGAGWVGVEAAARYGARELCFFDPSPNMVAIAEENARAAGVARFTGRVGFGESPPFPAHGEAPFDLVISSGVVSFSPDLDGWLDGLARTVAPGGQLVVGDIHRGSRGMRRRRREKPLLPVRELNATTREEVRAGLERRGFEHVRSAAYQLTRPVPEAMHVNETRLHGVLTLPLLWSNRLATAVDAALGSPFQDQFDSWVMHLRRA